MSDKYEDQRFDRSCPTCGQQFMQEKIDMLVAACNSVLETNAEFRKEYPQVTEEAPCLALVRAAVAKVTGVQP